MNTELAPNPTGLDELYEAHFADLAKVAYLMTGSAAAAEDAVHEVFLRCVDRLGDVDHPASYLRTSVVNECRNQHRKQQRADDYRRDVGPQVTLVTDDGLPHEILETREALAILSDRQRAAVVLRYFVDLPDREIADILDCRPSTVRSLIHRGLAQLREVLS